MHGRIHGTGKPIDHNHFQSISIVEKKKAAYPSKCNQGGFFSHRSAPYQCNKDDMATHEAKDMVTKHKKCVDAHKTTAQRTNGPKN